MTKLGVPSNVSRALACLAILLSMVACSSNKPKADSREVLLERLTDFAVAVNGDQYDKALDLLTTTERGQMTGADGKISSEMQKRLKALRLPKLLKTPSVRLVEGKLEGVYAILPMVENDPTLDNMIEEDLGDSSAIQPESPVESEPTQAPSDESQIDTSPDPVSE